MIKTNSGYGLIAAHVVITSGTLDKRNRIVVMLGRSMSVYAKKRNPPRYSYGSGGGYPKSQTILSENRESVFDLV